MAGVNSTGTKRTRLSPARRRAQLIDLGVQMLSERSLEQISVDEIADEAGVSRGLLFHYFSSKHDFYVEIVRHISRDMLDRTAPDESLDPIAMLRGTIVAYVDYVTERRDTYVSMLRGAGSSDPDMTAVFEQTRTAMVDRTAAHLPLLGIDVTPAIHLAVRGWIAFVEDTTIVWLRDSLITREEFVELAVGALPAVVAVAGATVGVAPSSRDAVSGSS